MPLGNTFKIIPEAEGVCIPNRKLVIYLRSDESKAIKPQIQDLNDYLISIDAKFCIKIISDSIKGETNIEPEFDIIVDSICYLKDKDSPQVLTINKTLETLESFAIGHNVPWSFEMPMYGSTLSSHFTLNYSEGKRRVLEFEKRIKKVDSKEIELWRSILIQKYQQMEYAKHMLNFFNIQKKIAKKNGFKRQDYTFEFGYHFTHYQVIMSSCLDIAARIIRLRHFSNLKLSRTYWKHQDFTKKLSQTPYSQLNDLLDDDEMKDWFKILKDVRNFSAHEGTTMPTSILMEPKEGLPSDKQIQDEIMKTREYKNMESILGKKQMATFLPSMISKRKIELYDVLKEHVIVILKDKHLLQVSLDDGVTWFNKKYSIFFEKFLQIANSEDS